MDIDEDEVTREPFYQDDEEEGEEYEYELHANLMDEHCEEVGQRLQSQSNHQNHAEGDIECAEEDDNSISSINSHDINFAKSFDIHLQSSKTQAAALFESEYIVDINRNDLQGTSQLSSRGVMKSNREPLIETSISSDCIQHRGVFLQTGDIVALCDQDDGLLYFAQLSGFVQDIYCEKSASVNWLVPIRSTSREVFVPTDYKIGLEDTQLRKLDSMIFIRHCPSDYYLKERRNEARHQNEVAIDLRRYRKHAHPYIWTSMEPCNAPKIELSHQPLK